MRRVSHKLRWAFARTAASRVLDNDFPDSGARVRAIPHGQGSASRTNCNLIQQQAAIGLLTDLLRLTQDNMQQG